MIRLFVALRPPRSIRVQLLSIMHGIDGARWQDDEQLHLTLRFIGEVNRRQAEDIAAVLGSLHATRFEIALSGVGTFGRCGRIDTLWAGVTPRAPLATLHRKVDQALIRTGVAAEGRAYTPHITLARLNRAAGPVEPFIARHANLTSAPFAIEHIVLYDSTVAGSSSLYTMVMRWPLGVF